MSFSIEASTHRGVARIRVSGELDLAVRADLVTMVTSHLGEASIERVIIDLADVTFLDSTGIGALVGCKHLAVDAGKHVQAVGAVGHVAAVLDLTGVTGFLAD